MTQRARKRQRRSRGTTRRTILLVLGLVFTLVVMATAGAAAWVWSVWANTPSIDTLKPIHQGENSVVYAADGSRLGYIQSDTIRHPVDGADMPNYLREATVAIEDKNFYEHGGIDPEAIIRAAVADLKAGSPVQGGSTITQQLVRNLYIAHPQEDLQRKIEEAKLAQEYEDKYSKSEILTKYLNTASYGTIDGRTTIGVQGASETYFSKPVSQLSLEQSALLAGLPQAPSEYNPFLNPKAALERRNEVLQVMREQGYIGRNTYERALHSGLELNRGYKYETIHEPYFFDYVTQQLIDRYGVNTVRNGGLKVYTTIDPRLQADAHQAIASHPYGGPSSALVSIDPSNGHIVAMASSQQYSTADQFNLAAFAHRQPGSSFKPYVLTTALRQGMDPDTTYYNGTSPVTLTLDDGTTWTVNNAEPGGGVMNVRDATINSVNAVFAQLDLDVGPDNVRQTAYDLGITTHLDGYPAEGIGGLRIGVTPLEQANAYATFADGGVRNTPTAISKVVFPNGDVDEPSEGTRTRAISDGIAYEVTDILKGVITSGTGTAANFGCPAAGKTGTTDDFTDAWFVGYTPQLSTAVWVGYANSRTSMGYDAFGGTLAAPIWHDYMEAAHGSFCGDFPSPQNPFQPSPSWSGAHEVSKVSPTHTGGTGTTTPTPPAKPGAGGGNKYPPQYYAPGAGQGAPPSGGDTSGGPPSGGPPAHSNAGGNGSAGGTGPG